jgi:DNA-3-methyladenine glycosylase
VTDCACLGGAGGEQDGAVKEPKLYPLDPRVFDTPALVLAERLIGVSLYYDGIGGVIVETEAYTRDDPASHSFRGPDKSNASMFGSPGRAYVYRSYGLHWCLNAVAAEGGAVLIRALEPQTGLALMAARRGGGLRLCSGPGRLTQALAVTGRDDGRDLLAPPFQLSDRLATPKILHGPRIGISRAKDVPWRFGLAGSADLSRPIGRGTPSRTPPNAPP